MIIGTTGIFGSGKSTVSKMFEESGYFVIDVDKLYSDLIITGSDLYNNIIKSSHRYTIVLLYH